VDVDQRIVPQDRGVVGRDEAHAAHVGGQRIDVVDAAGGQQALVEAAEVAQLELVGVRVGVLGTGDVHPPHPVAPLLQRRDEVVADEAAGPCDQNTRIRWSSHLFLSASLQTETASRPRGHCRPQFPSAGGAVSPKYLIRDRAG
jgi:hypothetical protein